MTMDAGEITDYSIVLDAFETPFYYGPKVEIVLPTKYDGGVSEYHILDDGEKYSPVPYVVAIYQHSYNNMDVFVYKFEGIEIRNND